MVRDDDDREEEKKAGSERREAAKFIRKFVSVCAGWDGKAGNVV